MKKTIALVRLCALAILLAASTLMINSCKDEKITPVIASKGIGETGGTLAGTDGVVSVNIPAGALSASTTVSIKISDEIAPANGIGKVYTLTPDGAQFAKPVKLSFQYSEQDALNIPTSSMTIAFKKSDGTWQVMPTLEINKATRTIVTETTHFSQWILLQIPTIVSFTPATGIVGTSVTITGNDFSATTSENIVLMNGIPATVTSSTTTQLVFIVPAGAASGKILVTTKFNGLIYTVLSPTDFTVEANEPAITSFTPSTGPVGTVVTITGKNFSAVGSDNTVMMNGIPAIVTSSTTNQIVFTVPGGATSGKITVQTKFNLLIYTVVSSTDFTVETNEPVITSFTPSTGPVGTVVTITGKNFSSLATDNTVMMNGISATVTSSTTTQLVFIVPAGATSAKIMVLTKFNTFQYTIISTSDFIVN